MLITSCSEDEVCFASLFGDHLSLAHGDLEMQYINGVLDCTNLLSNTPFAAQSVVIPTPLKISWESGRHSGAEKNEAGGLQWEGEVAKTNTANRSLFISSDLRDPTHSKCILLGAVYSFLYVWPSPSFLFHSFQHNLESSVSLGWCVCSC